jgi:hypothetical protein
MVQFFKANRDGVKVAEVIRDVSVVDVLQRNKMQPKLITRVDADNDLLIMHPRAGKGKAVVNDPLAVKKLEATKKQPKSKAVSITHDSLATTSKTYQNQDSNIPDIALSPAKKPYDPLSVFNRTTANAVQTIVSSTNLILPHKVTLQDPLSVPATNKRALSPPKAESSKLPKMDPAEYLKRVKKSLTKPEYKQFQSCLRSYKANELNVVQLLEGTYNLYFTQAPTTERTSLFRDFRSFIGGRNYKLFDEFLTSHNIN